MEAGDRVADRFTLISLAGKGGMGEVWRAHDAHLGADVAVKVLRFSGSAADRFQRECKVLATLQHPAIVAYVSHGVTEGGQLFLAMEWLDGEDLGDRLGRGTVSIEESLALTGRVAAALAEAHRRGIVHRDLKPENIFLVGGSPRDVRVLDFGIARVLEGTRAITKTGALIGTPGYMSPEQARGETSLGPPSDIFSLGCVLFECITGHRAFSGDQLVAVLAKLLLAEPPRLSAYRTDVPPELDSLLARMLQKEPAARPPDAAALLENLEDVRTGIKSPSGLPVPIPSFAPSERRIVSIILAGSPDPTSAETLVSGEDQRRSEVIRNAASSPDLRLESLADGTSVLVLEGGGEAKDRAERAASAALAVRRAAPDLPMSLATGWTRAGGGLPVGEVIDRAVRQLAAVDKARECNGVVVDQPTAQLLRGRFTVEDRDGHHVLLGESDIAAATTARSYSAFVGRDSVVERLLLVIRESCEERFPRAIIVSGNPGVGKSRVREEVLARLAEQDSPPAIWLCRGDALARGAPLHVLRQMLQRELLADEGRAEACAGRASLHDSLSRIVAPDRQAVVERYLSEVLGLAAENDEELHAARTNPEVLRARIRDAFAEFIASVTARTPVVFVIEDMQNGDIASLKVFERVIRDRRDMPVVFLAFGRPEIRELLPLLETDWDLTVMRLQGLRSHAAEALVRGGLGPDATDQVVERVLRLGEGNPLQLEELIRATLEQRARGWKSESGTLEFELPESLATILSSRLERLEPKLRTVVRVASIFGEAFTTEGVRALLGTYDREAIELLLSELVRAEIISPDSPVTGGADPGYRFRQGLVRDAAYASLSQDDRAIGHGLAASIEKARRNPEPDTLAHHLIAAGRPDEGARQLLEAARDAWIADDANGAAIRMERALSIAKEPTLIGEVHLLAARALAKLDHLGAAEEHATAALGALPLAHPQHFEALAHRAALRSLGGSPLAGQDAASLVAASNEQLGGPLVAASVASAAFNLLNTLDRYGGEA
ncbi:MAG: protein kinase, partial [Deltaproteobacteria bacterium]|nr:protein kinase [Deltaproteobacteria bacterium]